MALSQEFQRVLDRSLVSIDASLSDEEAGEFWAREHASWHELWAIETLISDLYDSDIPLAIRVASSIGQGPDVFWFFARGKACKEVSHHEALAFVYSASKVLLGFRMELRAQTATNEDDEEFMRATKEGLEKIRSAFLTMK